MDITVRPLEERDLPEADRIFRTAFGTFLGLPDPVTFLGDADLVYSRWRAAPEDAIAADVDGKLAGSMFVANWGSVGFFGPLTVHPDHWDKGVARRLLDATMAKFEAWGTRYPGLFTFAHSPKHLFLYQKYGFHPRFLTPILSKAPAADARRRRSLVALLRAVGIRAARPAWTPAAPSPTTSSTGSTSHARSWRSRPRSLATPSSSGTARGWPASPSATTVRAPRPAATPATSSSAPPAPAPTPAGARASSGSFRPPRRSPPARGSRASPPAPNAGRPEAYRQMIARGFRADFVGVAMQHDNQPGYNRPGAYVIDDWR